MRAALALPLLLAFLLAACTSESAEDPPADHGVEIPFRKDGVLEFVSAGGEVLATIDIEIAETDSARTRGLMQRTSLPERSGMLFIFDLEEPQSFWMANTPMALDLFFVDADSQVVRVRKYTRPFSPSSVTSEAPAQFVVEVPAGFADTYGITEGDRIRWRRVG